MSRFLHHCETLRAEASRRESRSPGKSFARAIACFAGLFAFCALLAACGEEKPLYSDGSQAVADAWAKFKTGNCDSAINILKKSISKAGKGDSWRAEALYALACAYDFKTPTPDKELAMKVYAQILREEQGSVFAGWSELALIRQTHTAEPDKAPDYPALRKDYENVCKRHPDDLAGQEAFLCMIGARISQYDKEEARIAMSEIDEFFKRYPDSRYASAIWMERSYCDEMLEDFDSTLQDRIRSLEAKELDPSNPAMNNSSEYWAIATIAEFRAGDLETARKYYQRLLDEYPKNLNSFSARKALERLGSIQKSLKAGKAFTGESL